MSLLTTDEPIFCSVLLDLISPKVDSFSPQAYLKRLSMPDHLEDLGVVSTVERSQLIHNKENLTKEVKYILGDFWRP